MRICLLKDSPQVDPCFNKLTAQGGRKEGRLLEGQSRQELLSEQRILAGHTGRGEGRAVQAICDTD